MRVIDLIIVIGWLAFWSYWLISAMSAKSSRRGQSAWRRFAGTRVAIVIVVLFLGRALGFHSHSGKPTDPVQAGIGLALFVLGLAFAVWARVYIGRNWGMPMTQRAEPELVTSGPYRRVRHPIYTGIITAMIGSVLVVNIWGLIAVAVLGGYFIFSATREESFLTKEFPDSYPAYKHSTKMLVPFVF